MAAIKLSGQYHGLGEAESTLTANTTFVLSSTQNIVFSKHQFGPLGR
jgi:hypothetical protein